MRSLGGEAADVLGTHGFEPGNGLEQAGNLPGHGVEQVGRRMLAAALRAATLWASSVS